MIILTEKNENETATPAKASVAKNTRALTPPAATKPSGDAVADASVRRVYMGIDLHKLKAVTTVRLDNAPPQPAQGVPTENFVEWVQKQKHRYPNAEIFFCYEAGPCGYWLYCLVSLEKP